MQCLPTSCIGRTVLQSALSVIAGTNSCAAMVHSHAETPESHAPMEPHRSVLNPSVGLIWPETISPKPTGCCGPVVSPLVPVVSLHGTNTNRDQESRICLKAF